MPPLLEIEDVQKWVGPDESRTEIVRGVSLSVEPGEFIAIMGTSGSGKSTLMNMIGLLDLPSAGRIRILGRATSECSDDELAALRAQTIGFIFQSFQLLPYLNVSENIMLGMAYHAKQDAAARTQELLSEMQLTHRARAYPATLSGGERQRVAIARALSHRPALILADEPTGSLDSATGNQVMDLLAENHRRGTTIILVTHDAAVARRAQKIFKMRDGQLE